MLVFAATAGAAAEAVLLNNGSVVSGQARHEAEAVVVRVSAGGEVRLRPADVAAVRPSLPALYDWLREKRAGARVTAEDCFDLAEWCLRNGLWPQASRELLEARSLDPESARGALLERRLMLLSRPQPSAEPEPKAATESPPDPPIAAADDVPSVAFPEGGLEHFAKRIQPVLLNNCTTSGCHRAGAAGAFPLDRRVLHGYGDARSTRHNLRIALAAIDLSQPASSPIVVAARGPHHGAAPIRGPRREELLIRLEEWVATVAAAQPAVALAPPPAVATGVRTASHEQPIETEVEQPAERPAPARITRGGLLQAVEPSDEFDPEIFNRRFRREADDMPLDAADE